MLRMLRQVLVCATFLTPAMRDVALADGKLPFKQIDGAAASGANSDITSILGLTTPLAATLGGTGTALGYQVVAPHLWSNSSLAAASTTAYPHGVWRDDFYPGNGAPEQFYKPSASACSLNSGAGDNGSQIPSGDGKCWIAAFGATQDVREWGAIADATGAPNVGTDNCAAFTAAFSLPFMNIVIPNGNFRWTCFVAVGNQTAIGGAGIGSTLLWYDEPTGALDGLGINANNTSVVAASTNFHDFWILPTAQRTAGALVHATDTYGLTFQNFQVGYYSISHKYSYDNILIDCKDGGQLIDEIRFNNVISENPTDDGIKLSCPYTTNSISDVYISPHSYNTGAAHAGLEIAGNVGWVEAAAPNFDADTGYGLLATTISGATIASYINVQGGHWEQNGHDVSITGFGHVNINAGNQFVTGDGITCNLCSDGNTSGNMYTENAGLQLNGVNGWTDVGSSWDTANASRAGMVVVSPSGSTPSTNLVLGYSSFPFTGTVPFVDFAGSSAPATNVKLSINAGESQCWGGTNFTQASFSADCDSVTSQNALTKTGGFITPTPTSGVQGNLYYDPTLGWRYHTNGAGGGVFFNSDITSTGTRHSIEFFIAPVNAAGAGAAAAPSVIGWVDQAGNFQWKGGVFPAPSAVSALPTCNTALKGAIFEVSDALSPAYGATLAGGGSVEALALCSGSAWTAH